MSSHTSQHGPMNHVRFPSLTSNLLIVAFLAFGCSDSLLGGNSDDDRDPDDESEPVTADVVGQGTDGSVVAEEGAQLWRNENDIAVEISMPTPEAGTYDYPEDADVGPPEVFTLWVFVFDDPAPFGGPEASSLRAPR